MAREEKVETSNKFHVPSADEEEDPVNALSVNTDAEPESFRFRDLTLQGDDPAHVLETPGLLIPGPPTEHPTDGPATMWRPRTSAKMHDAKEEGTCPSEVQGGRGNDMTCPSEVQGSRGDAMGDSTAMTE